MEDVTQASMVDRELLQAMCIYLAPSVLQVHIQLEGNVNSTMHPFTLLVALLWRSTRIHGP